MNRNSIIEKLKTIIKNCNWIESVKLVPKMSTNGRSPRPGLTEVQCGAIVIWRFMVCWTWLDENLATDWGKRMWVNLYFKMPPLHQCRFISCTDSVAVSPLKLTDLQLVESKLWNSDKHACESKCNNLFHLVVSFT